MAARELPIKPHHIAYSFRRRIRDVFKHYRAMRKLGFQAVDNAKARRVGATYGVAPDIAWRIKNKFRSELSFSGEGK